MGSGRKKYVRRKEKFIGWGSKKLLFFLASIGRNVAEPISESDVYDIVVSYINENNLRDPKKKKKVICDVNLHSLLGRKSINRNRISALLESHFPENQSSEDESLDGSLDDLATCKRQKSDIKISKAVSFELNEMALEAQKNCFASISEKTVKLVYLRRSLLEKFVQSPETIESKVVDCFVRVKSDLNCYRLPKTPFQLVQITGIKRASGSYASGEFSTDIVLKASDVMKDIHICMVSDDDFSEEECKDLCERMKEGHLKRPTVGEMEKKARSLHEDITNHWIDREILLLNNRIERANEKGWRRELFQYIDELELLKSPLQRMKMLTETPKIAADEEIVLECSLKSFFDPERADEGNGEANQMDHEAPVELMASEKKSEGREADNCMDFEPSANFMDPKRENQEGKETDTWMDFEASANLRDLKGENKKGNGDPFLGNVGKSGTEESTSSIYSFFFGDGTASVVPKQNDSGLKAVSTDSRQQHYIGETMNGTTHLEDSELHHEKAVENKDAAHENGVIILVEDENTGNTDVKPSLPISNANGTKETEHSIAVIEIDDDEDDNGEVPCVARMVDENNHQNWHYLDPSGEVQGPFPMSALKYWKEAGYFTEDFRVWRVGQTPENGILLTDAIRLMPSIS